MAPGKPIVLHWLLPPSPPAINAGVQLSLWKASSLGDTLKCTRTHGHMENINIITKSKEQVRTAATQPWVIQSEHPQHTPPPKVIGLGGCVAQPCCWAQLIIGWLMWSHWPVSQRAQSFKQETLLASWSCCHIWTMESSQGADLCRRQRSSQVRFVAFILSTKALLTPPPKKGWRPDKMTSFYLSL